MEEKSEPIDIIHPVTSKNTMKALFSKVDFDDTVKLIKEIPELEKIALKKYNKNLHTLLWAVHHNKLHVVKWIYLHGFESPTEITLESSAKRGHLEILIWLIQNTTINCTQRTLDIAACNGQEAVVKWIHLNTDIKANSQTIEWTNEQGYYTLSAWLTENTEGLDENNGYNIYNFLKKKITSFYK